ncbi:MAG: hypothetical protein J5931_08695 [Prevotella sp.]|nr:hypothetical protein [Prevotella sp.]
MKVTDKVLEIVQDHTRVTDTIDSICCAIENGTDMPNFIPVCNDTMVSDQLGKIAETITNLRKKLL